MKSKSQQYMDWVAAGRPGYPEDGIMTREVAKELAVKVFKSEHPVPNDLPDAQAADQHELVPARLREFLLALSQRDRDELDDWLDRLDEYTIDAMRAITFRPERWTESQKS